MAGREQIKVLFACSYGVDSSKAKRQFLEFLARKKEERIEVDQTPVSSRVIDPHDAVTKVLNHDHVVVMSGTDHAFDFHDITRGTGTCVHILQRSELRKEKPDWCERLLPQLLIRSRHD